MSGRAVCYFIKPNYLLSSLGFQSSHSKKRKKNWKKKIVIPWLLIEKLMENSIKPFQMQFPYFPVVTSYMSKHGSMLIYGIFFIVWYGHQLKAESRWKIQTTTKATKKKKRKKWIWGWDVLHSHVYTTKIPV